MNAHNQNLNANGAQPVKPSIPMLAAEHLGTSYIQMLLQELKAAPDVWQKLSENQQHEIIERARQNAARSIAGAVNAIITNGHTALGGTIESVNIKDKIKLTVIVAKGNDSEALAELYQSGSEAPCQIMLGNAEQYLGGMDRIQAEPNQPELFDPETPEDSLLWAINIPILSGNSVVPCPNRKDAETYARSIRNKFLEDENEANHDYAKLVYAMPWTESPGAHNRSMAKGNWEAILNWFSKLCRGEVVVEPIALLEFVPEAESDYSVESAATEVDDTLVDAEFDPNYVAPADDNPIIIEPLTDDTDEEVDAFHTPESVQFDEVQPDDGIAIVEVVLTPEQVAYPIIATVRLKGDHFVAEYLGYQSKSKISPDIALSGLSAKLGLTGNIHHEEITTEHDKDAQVRRFVIKADQAKEA